MHSLLDCKLGRDSLYQRTSCKQKPSLKSHKKSFCLVDKLWRRMLGGVGIRWIWPARRVASQNSSSSKLALCVVLNRSKIILKPAALWETSLRRNFCINKRSFAISLQFSPKICNKTRTTSYVKTHYCKLGAPRNF